MNHLMNYMYGNVMYYLNLRKLWLSDAFSYIFHLLGGGPSEKFVWRGRGMFQMLLYLSSIFLWLHCYMNLRYLNLSKGGGVGLTSWRPRPCNSCILLNELFWGDTLFTCKLFLLPLFSFQIWRSFYSSFFCVGADDNGCT